MLGQAKSCLLGLGIAVALSACGGGSSSSSGGAAPRAVADCTDPLAMEIQQHTVVSNLPNSYDPDNTDDAIESPTTTFSVSVFLPERCPGETFPVVVQSHGYSGSREMNFDDDGVADPDEAHFPAINTLFGTLPYHGYIGVSYEQRGHGDSVPANGGGHARVIDPQAETQDGIALLDWLASQADTFQIETENSGIANDFKLGTLGYSYGGGYQFPLALLDERVDTIVPNGTWHSIINSLLPGDAVKNSFDAFLCLLADNGGVVNTPALDFLCDRLGATNPNAGSIRTREDLLAETRSEGFSDEAVLRLFQRHVRYFQKQDEANQPWCEQTETGCTSGGQPFEGRATPTLLVQGNRDVLFNMTETYWNWDYLRNAGDGSAEVAVITTEGGHMNPLPGSAQPENGQPTAQTEGTANCGNVIGVDAIRAWFDFHLKGARTPAYDNLAPVCISVADTASADTAPPVGVLLNEMPLGQQVGTGAVAARLEQGSATVTQADNEAVFLPVVTIAGDNQVLAGIPSIDQIDVIDGDDELIGEVDAVAHIGVGIQRGGTTILVDDQVTALLQGSHTSNPNIGNDKYLLPGIGEQLQDGDVVGLVFYQNHVQYSAVTGAGAPGTNPLNPYSVTVSGVELPIIDVSLHPNASLSTLPAP